MSDNDSIEELREQKIENLQSNGDTGTHSPTDPIQIGSSADLSEAVERYEIVLADFYADWCGPCQMIAPIVEEIAAETPAAVAKIDVDANQQLAGEYGVRGVPTLVLFAGGESVEQLVGVQQKDELVAKIEQYSS
ncbi:thioredoxin [Haloarcula montana]|uniref:thioredoxin n=1 Tax=Haloarcula montana TaxID=3111776 RepID=UPI002D7921AF|nr:thioredoxin [Haloarcula sp. GH36]